MIRINLLAGSCAGAARAGGIDLGQRVTVACSVILVATVVVIGWRFWSVRESAAQMTRELAAADQELARLAPVLESLAELERLQIGLAERVELIEELRRAQTGPVRMLDQISRSLPDGLWVFELRQSDEGVVVQGRATTLMVARTWRAVGRTAGASATTWWTSRCSPLSPRIRRPRPA